MITPELIAWLNEQRNVGCSDESLVQALIKAGYDQSFALQFVQGSVAEQNVDATAAENNGGGSLLSSIPKGSEEFFADTTQDQRSLTEFNTRNVRTLSDRAVKILMQLSNPRVAVFEGLVSPEECDELIAAAKPRLDPSKTVDSVSGDSVMHSARVSSGMFFRREEFELIQSIEARISQLLKVPINHGEGLQILHYKPGGKYDPHHDYFTPSESGSQVHLSRGGQRIGTLIIYLNTPVAGGGTVFPETGLTVSAVKGNALFFSYPLAAPESLSLHGGNPVLEGEKWIATKWIRSGVFV
ncbi:MAG: 2OG-Fe(II) oxygenase [Burkholderiales bacterium]|nr:2OG-Fe(II) oxygenase [Burkholderiales bacterium]